MQDGALGVASALIYAPGNYRGLTNWSRWPRSRPNTRDLYLHMRNEGDREMEALDELLTIARKAQIPAESIT